MKRITLFLAALAASLLSLEAQQTTDFTGKVPSKFTVELDFDQGWPFADELVKAADQKEEGEAYEYKFEQGKYKASLFFTLCKGPNGNTYSLIRKAGSLDFMRPEAKPDNCGYIKLPAVPGKYIKSVEITVSTREAQIYLCTAPQKVTRGAGLAGKIEAPDHGTAYVDFTPDQIAVGTPLYLYRNSSGAFRFSNLKVTYASPKGKK